MLSFDEEYLLDFVEKKRLKLHELKCRILKRKQLNNDILKNVKLHSTLLHTEKHIQPNILNSGFLKDLSFNVESSFQQKKIQTKSGKSVKSIIINKADLARDFESLLGAQTAKEKESQRINDEIMELLNMPTVKEKILNERFKTKGGSRVHQFCTFGTRAECRKHRTRNSKSSLLEESCGKLHFKKIIQSHTDDEQSHDSNSQFKKQSEGSIKQHIVLFPPQWIRCDIRRLDMSVLGKFSVIMADPPWDIHMELPYGTMSDSEMRKLDIPILQDAGYIFLWVTGRIDEIIWVKTNQLQRLIRTGRTGHWLNHGKEHCLVGVKGQPKGINPGLDCDIIVSEVRETSHKPDEVYGLIERLAPGTRKLELFGRPHNVQPNWITLGNQLDGIYLVDPMVVGRFKKRYPNGLDEDNASTKAN